MNKLISIGWIGYQSCYLNIERDEAIKRFCETDGTSPDHFERDKVPIKEFTFDDEFAAYDVWRPWP